MNKKKKKTREANDGTERGIATKNCFLLDATRDSIMLLIKLHTAFQLRQLVSAFTVLFYPIEIFRASKLISIFSEFGMKSEREHAREGENRKIMKLAK